MHWYALHVRSNFERRVQESLRQLGIEDFSPHHTCRSRFGKGGVVERPLLPGYVFARLALDSRQRIEAIRITGVVRIVGFGCDPAPIPSGQVEALRRLIASGAAVKRIEYHARKGDEVEITCGPMTGYHGVVERIGKRGTRITVSIHALQQSVQAEVESRLLRPARKAA